MKKLFLAMLLTLGLVFGGLTSNALADDVYQCDVVGNAYTVTLGGVEYTLMGWTDKCNIGPCPECGGEVDLKSSLGQYLTLYWQVSRYNQQLSIGKLPAVLTEDALTVYIPPTGLYKFRGGQNVYAPAHLNRTKIGQDVYMTGGEIPTLVFTEQE
jgi:hypothetical protein